MAAPTIILRGVWWLGSYDICQQKKTSNESSPNQLVGGWTNPSWKICASQIGSFPPGRLANQRKTTWNHQPINSWIWPNEMIFRQPRFPWKKDISLTKPPFGVRPCEVAIIWPNEYHLVFRTLCEPYLCHSTLRCDRNTSSSRCWTIKKTSAPSCKR